MNSKRGLAGRLVCAAGVCLLAGGCKNVPKSQYDSALEENRDLRDRITTLQSTVAEANEQTDAYERRNRELEGEVDRLSAELAAKQQSGGGAMGSTGFEGIPGVASVGARGEGLVVEVAGDVLFDTASITLKPAAKQSLDRIASVIQSRFPGHPIRVEGYTDSEPIRKSGWKTNERLSAERAMAVESYLVSRGVPNDLVHSAAFGPAHPKGSKKESRRVEIVILARGS